MALTKAEVEQSIAEIDVQLAELAAQEAAYTTGAIDDGETGGPPISPTLEEFLARTAEAKASLQQARADLVTVRDTQDFDALTGE